jgi:hypothetical protein
MLCTSAAAKTSAEPDTVEGLEIGVGDCATHQLTRGLAATALEGVISQGVSLLGAALTSAGTDKTWKRMSSRNLNGTLPECIQVMGGKFHTRPPVDRTDPSWWVSSGLPTGGFRTLATNGIWPEDRPDFFFEADLIQSNDKTAMAFRPAFAELYDLQGKRLLGSNNSRAVVLFFSMTKPGEDPNLDGKPGATVNLGTMVVGRPVRYATELTPSTPYESQWFALSDADAKKALTVSALESETQPGSEFFKFLASVFNRADVTKAINDKLNSIVIPSVGAQNAQTAAQSLADLQNAADQKLQDALSKLALCKSGGVSALANAEAAKEALRAYELADEKLPHPTAKISSALIDSITLTAPSKVAQQCGSAYRSITGESAP